MLRNVLQPRRRTHRARRQRPAPHVPRPLAQFINVRGARQHNLKDIDVDIPRDQLTVCCGPSGSGKTSLAMDTIYAEGQRRYVESLSAYARQFVGQMQKPKVDHIEGLSPAMAIEQKHSGHSPRSTVGTVTEIYDYLRILMSRLGQPHCPACDVPIGSQSADEIIAKIMAQPAGTKLYLMAPLEIRVGERYETLWEETRASGYVRIRVDGQTYSVDQPPRDRPPAEARRRGGDRPGDGSPGRPLADRRQRGERPVAGPRRAARGLSARRRARAAMAGRNAQPALRLRPVRAELRAALAAQLLVQQRAWAGARPARAWARRPARIPPRCCAIRSSRWPKAAVAALAERRQPACSPRCSRRFRAARASPSTCRSTNSAAATAG